MDRKQIEALIDAQGYIPRIKETPSQRANGVIYRYVYARPRGTGSVPVYLGKLEEVKELTEKALVQRIAERFAAKASAKK